MRVKSYDPDQRAEAKAASRKADDEALRSREVSREEMQRINGNGDLFRNARILHIPRQEDER